MWLAWLTRQRVRGSLTVSCVATDAGWDTGGEGEEGVIVRVSPSPALSSFFSPHPSATIHTPFPSLPRSRRRVAWIGHVMRRYCVKEGRRERRIHRSRRPPPHYCLYRLPSFHRLHHGAVYYYMTSPQTRHVQSPRLCRVLFGLISFSRWRECDTLIHASSSCCDISLHLFWGFARKTGSPPPEQ